MIDSQKQNEYKRYDILIEEKESYACAVIYSVLSVNIISMQISVTIHCPFRHSNEQDYKKHQYVIQTRVNNISVFNFSSTLTYYCTMTLYLNI